MRDSEVMSNKKRLWAFSGQHLASRPSLPGCFNHFFWGGGGEGGGGRRGRRGRVVFAV